jgi:bacterioferritin (cytochrome b1)
MSLSIYEVLISDLKIKLNNDKNKFNNIFRLINNNYDITIHKLIENIIIERERIANDMNNKLNDLLWLNNTLIQFGEQPQPSKTKAKKLLKRKVFINIYDLSEGRYDKRTTKELLKKDLKENSYRRISLSIPKRMIHLKNFLIHVYERK